MTVLSDETLRRRISNNELVLDGTPEYAKHCSYEFTAAKIIRGGSSEMTDVVEPGVTISPAQLVWIRTCERISMPTNMVGLWIQTNTLSRQGLLLLNMSLVEPGYEGYLSAVFVNFGQRKVTIGPTTRIAKVIFLPLDVQAIEKVASKQFQNYDRWLFEIATNAPSSFLQLESFLPNLEERADAKLRDIDTELKLRSKMIQEEVKTRITATTTEAKYSIEKDLRSDVKGLVWRWGGGIFAGLIVGCVVVWFGISTLMPQMIASYSKVDDLVQKAIKVHQTGNLETLTGRVSSQDVEIQGLRKRLLELETKQGIHPSKSGSK